MSDSEKKIAPAELDVLQVLWAQKWATLRQIHDELSPQYAYTTVQTLLDRLVEKELVVRDRSKRPALHRAKVTRRRVVSHYVDWMLEKVCDGPAPLVMQLLKGQRFSSDELDEMRKLIDDAEKKQK